MMQTTTNGHGYLTLRCPTMCDDDCELNETNGCHEWHLPRYMRDHDPSRCISRLSPLGAVAVTQKGKTQ